MPESNPGWLDPEVSCERMLALYRQPELAINWSPIHMAAVLSAARRSRATAHLGLRFAQEGVLEGLDANSAGHFESAAIHVRHQRQMILWELDALARALRDFSFPIILLKGSAYIVSNLPMSLARFANDVDILVPKSGLDEAERLFRAAGWKAKVLNDYDERYYRELSQELPPFTHPEREVEVDLHHSISPDLRGDGVDTEKLLERSVQVVGEDHRIFRILDPVDQLIHCAIHTFKDSDLTLRLRETMDFDLLFRHYAAGASDQLADRVCERAIELGQQRPVWWAIHFARRWLGTPIPDSTVQGLSSPPESLIALMNSLADRAMLPGPTRERHGLDRLAAAALLARYHYNRMPLRVLIPHILQKLRHRFRAA